MFLKVNIIARLECTSVITKLSMIMSTLGLPTTEVQLCYHATFNYQEQIQKKCKGSFFSMQPSLLLQILPSLM